MPLHCRQYDTRMTPSHSSHLRPDKRDRLTAVFYYVADSCGLPCPYTKWQLVVLPASTGHETIGPTILSRRARRLAKPRPLKGATAETNMHKSTRRRSHRELCNDDQTSRLAPDGSPRMDECTYSTVSANKRKNTPQAKQDPAAHAVTYSAVCTSQNHCDTTTVSAEAFLALLAPLARTVDRLANKLDSDLSVLGSMLLIHSRSMDHLWVL